MRAIPFTKMVAAGNDFVLVDESLALRGVMPAQLSRAMCNRTYGIGADGLLLISKAGKAAVRMRIFNADGSEAEMCGNGSRCVAAYAAGTRRHLSILTKAGLIEAEVHAGNSRIKLTTPKDIRLDVPLRLNNRRLMVNFVNTGVPHVVIFSAGLAKLPVATLGRDIRFHRAFAPAGANVNFVEVTGRNAITVRTYERGVEDETMACGTGSVASALIFSLKSGPANVVRVTTRGNEVLRVYFHKDAAGFREVWLEGPTRIICRGTFLYQSGGGGCF